LSGSNGFWSIGLLALLVGLALRWWSIHQARFSGEESWFWSVGRDIATGRAFPVLGHPISGTAARHPGAAFFYFLGLTQLAGPSPLRAYGAVSLGGLAVLAPLAWAVARAFGRATALAFLILSAVSPWWIVYTNSAWPGYLQPTLCGLVLVWLPCLAGRRNAVAEAGLAFLLVIGFQIHLSLAHYWLIALVTIAVWRPNLARRALLGGAIAGVLCYIPYLVDEIRHGFALQGLLLSFVAFTTTDISYLWNQGFWFPFDLAHFWRGGGVERTRLFFEANGLAPVAWAALAASWIVTALSWGFFARLIWRRLRTNPRAPGNVLPIAFLTAVGGIPLFYLLSGKGGYPHYVSTVLPLAFLPPAVLLGRLLARPILRWGAGAYLCLFAVGGFLGLRGYYAVDSHWSVPQSTAAVGFILDRTRAPDGGQLPFRLEIGLSPRWPSAYQLIAKYVYHAPFPIASSAAHGFRIEARAPNQPGNAPDDDRLSLPTITVRHTVGQPGRAGL
jgi:hypothetical protein